jgi:hypothetical protein
MSDEVGYKRPPRQHQFQPGRSGNPRGRPKGSKNLATDLAAVLRGKVEITQGGKRRRVTRQRAMLLKLSDQGLEGDVRASVAVMQFRQRLPEPSDTRTEELCETDRQIVDDFLRRHAAVPPKRENHDR